MKINKKEKKIIKKEEGKILFDLIFALTTLFIVLIFYKNILLTTLLLLVVSGIFLLKCKSWLTFSMFIFATIWGPTFEMIAISFGVWEYPVYNFFNIPIWLFILWGDAGAFLSEIAKELKIFGIRK